MRGETRSIIVDEHFLGNRMRSWEAHLMVAPVFYPTPTALHDSSNAACYCSRSVTALCACMCKAGFVVCTSVPLSPHKRHFRECET